MKCRGSRDFQEGLFTRTGEIVVESIRIKVSNATINADITPNAGITPSAHSTLSALWERTTSVSQGTGPHPPIPNVIFHFFFQLSCMDLAI